MADKLVKNRTKWVKIVKRNWVDQLKFEIELKFDQIQSKLDEKFKNPISSSDQII